MPNYRIRLINSTFESGEEASFPTVNAARKATVATAVTIVGEAVADGEVASAVEVQIFEQDRLVSRQVVTLSVADFTTGA